jgi:cell division protease FtsH
LEKRTTKGPGLFLLLILAGIAIFYFLSGRQGTITPNYTNENLEKSIELGSVAMVEIYQNNEVPTGTVYVLFTDRSDIRYFTADVKDTQKILEKNNVEYSLYDVTRPGWIEKLLPYAFATFLLVMLLPMFLGGVSAGGGGNSQILNFGKSRAKKDEETGITFNDVAGLEEEKEELAEVVDFLKDPGKYTQIGARIPKGIILVGPPGTGKTLLGKAVSGEAGVPFFSISGSDFVEMFVGVGASRVRDLFAEAKKNAPCIVFIDEIDAVARRRGTGLGGGHDEREQTLNQLLVEMDGFTENEGIIVMAATNRVDILDPAIMRPGRFDRKVAVGRPDVKGREEILKVHTRKKPVSDDVDLHEIARTTAGFSGADLENLMNEAAILSARQNKKYISKEEVDKAFIKVGIGTEKKSKLVSEKERKITAYHESGHAILFHELSEMDQVYTVSIIPTGVSAAGYTMPLPENDNQFGTRKKMLQEIMVDLGGRIAEELIFDDISTGASQDIKMASKTAREMVMKFGFSEKLGLVNYEAGDSDEVFLGRELGHEKPYGPQVAASIDEEVKSIIDKCYKEARAIIESKIDILHKSAEVLLERERITGAEFDALFANGNA